MRVVGFINCNKVHQRDCPVDALCCKKKREKRGLLRSSQGPGIYNLYSIGAASNPPPIGVARPLLASLHLISCTRVTWCPAPVLPQTSDGFVVT